MKKLHSATCSCTSCVYRSRSKQPSVQQLIEDGSRIDKLYYGKYLPLRERKLLEKLIRTRAVYDDVRNRLLSTSGSSDQRSEHKMKRRGYDSTEKSSAVLEMVDLVDRGQLGSSKSSKLSSCCSCCSCSSMRKIKKHMEKHPRVHRHHVPYEDIARYTVEAEKRGRRRRRKLSTKISSKIQAVRFKMKKIRSEPCTCTFSLNSVIKRTSKALVKKVRSKDKAIANAQAQRDVTKRKTLKDFKIAKVPMQSIQKIKNIRKSKTKSSGTQMSSQRVFKIKKDSLTLFREKLLKKRTLKDWECEPGICVVDECIPEQCLKKIKARGVGEKRKRKYHSRISGTGRERSRVSMSTQHKKVKKTDTQVQAAPSSSLGGTRFSMSTQHKKVKKTDSRVQAAHSSTLRATRISISTQPKKLKITDSRVQAAPSSTLKADICECKPTTKSASSMTSSSKSKSILKNKSTTTELQQKRFKSPKQKPKRTESYKFNETKPVQSLTRPTKSTSSMSFIPKSKTKMKAKIPKSTNQEKVFKTRRYKPIKEPYKYHETSKSSREVVLPFPRECEPSMCIPYECDPENCAQILLSRSKSRGRSVMSTTNRLRRKSTGSTTSSQKTSSKSKYIQSKSTATFVTKPREVLREPPPVVVEKDINVESSHPQRQAVKISSSISFNIEFYKDKSPGAVTVKTQDLSYEPKKEIRQKVHRKKYKERGQGTRNINSRQISSQSRSSESFKNIQVGHRLKRCFCTLKLLQKKKQKVRQTVSRKTMASLHNKDLERKARIRKTQTKSSGIAYEATSINAGVEASLLPYECEPNFCTPGECNPYECIERIKERNRKGAKRFSKETNTASIPRKSTFTVTSQSSSKSSSRKIQSSKNINEKRREKQREKRSHPLRRESRESDTAKRQAVRIGSSFAFNIEFSKQKKYQQSASVSDKLVKQERKRMKQKGIKVHKPSARHAASEITKNVKAKQTNTTPFLQKCFCTLKLFKKNKGKAETVTPLRYKNAYIVQMQNKSITTNRANIRYHYGHSKLLPYECEPGICVPNECDPYKCDKLIKLRHMKLNHNYSNTGDLTTRATFSKTSRTLTSSKSQNTRSYPRWSQEKANVKKDTEKDTNEMNVTPSHSKRQAVRIGSSFRFDVEFYKKKSSANDRQENVKTNEVIPRQRIHDKPIKKHKHKIGKLKTVGSQQSKPRLHHTAIDAEAKRKEKGNYVTSAIKRCFCTLKFHKKEKNTKLQEKKYVISKSTKASFPLPNPQISDSKSTSTKINKPMHDLRSHECAPNFCIPGMCDPFECYDEIKRQENKGLHDRIRRKSIMSMTTNDFSGNSKTKSTQSRFLQQTPKKEQKVRAAQEDMRSRRPFSPSRQAVRIGSKFSFNVDFFKDRSIPIFYETTYKVRGEKNNTFSDTRTVNQIKDKGTRDKRLVPKHRFSQVLITKEDKASNIGFLLKRCFCTLGLQKKHIAPKLKKDKHKFLRNQPITAQFLQVVQEDQNKKTACHFVIPHIKKRKYSEIINVDNIIKSRCSALNKALCDGESWELKLPESSNPFRRNMHENCKGNTCYVPQYLAKSSSFRKTGHFRSHIGFNIDKYQVGYSVNEGPQKTNPFLNLKLSKSRHNKCVCEYLNGINNNFERPKTGFIANTKKNKTASYHLNKPKSKELRVEPDLNIGSGFLKETKSRTDGIMISTTNKPKMAAASQMSYGSKKKATVLTQMLSKCLCTLNIKSGSKQATETKAQKDINTMAKKPDSLSENKKMVTDNLKPYEQKRLKSLQIFAVQTDHQKYKSTSNLVNNKKNLKSKRVQSKPVDGSARLKYSMPKKRHEKRFSQQHAVTFGSDISFDIGFIRRKTRSQSDRSGAPIRSSAIKGSGDNGRYGNSYGTSAVKCKCVSKSEKVKKKQDPTKIKSILKHYECLPETTKVNIEGKRGALDIIGIDVAKTTDTGLKKRPDLNKFVYKCLCTFDIEKGGNKLTPKKSIAKITDVKNKLKETKTLEKFTDMKKKHKLKETKILTPELKLEKGGKEMETIMPFSKKKFKKNAKDEQVKLTPEKENHNTSFFEQPCDKKLIGKMLLKCCSFVNKSKKKMKMLNEKMEMKKMEKEQEPVFEMVVNQNNMNIVNRNEVFANLGSKGQYSQVMKNAQKAAKQGKVLAPVMKVVIDKNKANIMKPQEFLYTVTGKKTRQTRGERKAFLKSPVCICKHCECRKIKQHRGFQPCICGSIVCKKDLERLKMEDRSARSVKFQKCVCGSTVCGAEMEKMPGQLLKAARKNETTQAQRQHALRNEARLKQERLKRLKLYAMEDAKRYKQRKQQDQADMKQIMAYKNAPDLLMVAESLQDLGKFSAKAFCDLMLNAFRMARHPSDGVHTIKKAIRDPERIVKSISRTAQGAGFSATMARIKQRLLSMMFLKKFVNTMEGHPVTNFIVHLPDRDPKKRMTRRKKKRLREPVDFECSAFMASMRKKPCLWVYYMCPWFYPHCMSMVTLWKQFVEVVLFILAIAVWSPCILAMEVFRFLMCFFFCQA